MKSLNAVNIKNIYLFFNCFDFKILHNPGNVSKILFFVFSFKIKIIGNVKKNCFIGNYWKSGKNSIAKKGEIV